MNATSANIALIAKPFAELTAHELHDVLRLRQAVFIVEQQCPYLDADGLDPVSLHLLARRINHSG